MSIDERAEQILDAISNYQSLPKSKQIELRPLYDETLSRAKHLEIYHNTLKLFYD